MDYKIKSEPTASVELKYSEVELITRILRDYTPPGLGAQEPLLMAFMDLRDEMQRKATPSPF